MQTIFVLKFTSLRLALNFFHKLRFIFYSIFQAAQIRPQAYNQKVTKKLSDTNFLLTIDPNEFETTPWRRTTLNLNKKEDAHSLPTTYCRTFKSAPLRHQHLRLSINV